MRIQTVYFVKNYADCELTLAWVTKNVCINIERQHYWVYNIVSSTYDSKESQLVLRTQRIIIEHINSTTLQIWFITAMNYSQNTVEIAALQA